MRQIILDTETTGLDANLGHRIIEVAAVEMINRRLTGNHFHHYLNPQREIDPGAQQVHGISLEFLQDKPFFRDVAQDFIEFISGAELVIHNAPFDIGFLNSELKLAGLEPVGKYSPDVIDTLKMAKDLRPGQKNNLDALCRHYQVDNASRTLHGALLDTELLAEVYLAMTRGQNSLMIESVDAGDNHADLGGDFVPHDLMVLAATSDEMEAHSAYLGEIDKASKGACLWRALESGA
ncbi:MAG: DNA polymerase III subunit epsilon [Sulfuricella sp.]|nr:DNA polymerase III subunit epsilon [Sulfuricella sp.]